MSEAPARWLPLVVVFVMLAIPNFGYGDSAVPVLNSISVDKVSVDVSSGSQTVTFTIDASAESGINWDAGANGTGVLLSRRFGTYKNALKSSIQMSMGVKTEKALLERHEQIYGVFRSLSKWDPPRIEGVDWHGYTQ